MVSSKSSELKRELIYLRIDLSKSLRIALSSEQSHGTQSKSSTLFARIAQTDIRHAVNRYGGKFRTLILVFTGTLWSRGCNHPTVLKSRLRDSINTGKLTI